ncbi:MAG: WGR domain-containing protein [Methylococcales bacterium]
MKPIYLQRHDSTKNLHRFYQLFVIRGLLDDWSLVKEWGRVGSPGTVRKVWFESEVQANDAALLLAKQKLKRGYV